MGRMCLVCVNTRPLLLLLCSLVVTGVWLHWRPYFQSPPSKRNLTKLFTDDTDRSCGCVKHLDASMMTTVLLQLSRRWTTTTSVVFTRVNNYAVLWAQMMPSHRTLTWRLSVPPVYSTTTPSTRCVHLFSTVWSSVLVVNPSMPTVAIRVLL